MARNFNELRAKMSPARRAANEAHAKQILEEIALSELRELQKMTQEDLAESLGTEQPNVSRLERREDMLVSTLANTVKGLGGTLELRAEFPNGDSYVVALGKR